MRDYDAGNLCGAAQGFERVLGLDGHHPQAHYELGNVRREQSRWTEAKQNYESHLLLIQHHAEAHNNHGVVTQMIGQYAEAIESFSRAAKLKPELLQPYLNLGRLLTKVGREDEAKAWYRKGQLHTPEVQVFEHLISALEGRHTERAPAAYIRQTFDEFAAHFDEQLLDRLEYRLPEAILSVSNELGKINSNDAQVLDLGCGTGLAGQALRPIAKRLVGVDLSPKMLERARARNCYDDLVEAEISEWMSGAVAGQFDIIVAADVFIYVGALDTIVAQAARLARCGAHFIFSCEVCHDADWRLQSSGRYAHSSSYIERLATEHGFAVSIQRQQAIRKPVTGLFYVLTRK